MAPKKFNNPRAAGEEPSAKRAGATSAGRGRGRGWPDGLSDTEWANEVERRKTVTADRKARDERKKAKEAEEAKALPPPTVAAR